MSCLLRSRFAAPPGGVQSKVRTKQHHASTNVSWTRICFRRLMHISQSACAFQPGAGLSICPTCCVTRIEPHLLRRFHSPSSFDRMLLAVWPSARHPWSPPPRRMCKGWVRTGDRECSDLSGGRRQSDDDCHCRDLDLAEPNTTDVRRLWVANGFRLCGEASWPLNRHRDST